MAHADGSSPVELTYSTMDSSPSWSPDGNKISFVGGGKDGLGIATANSDGSNQQLLIRQGFMPDWSPDLSLIAYVSAVGTKSGDPNQPSQMGVFTAESNGSHPLQLTEGTKCKQSTCNDDNPDWSPDGTKIVYAAGASIVVMDASGHNKVMITDDGGNPTWSPDGNWIAFDRQGDDMGVYVINVGGTGEKQIAEGAWPASRPSLAGTYIVAIVQSGANVALAHSHGSGQVHTNLIVVLLISMITLSLPPVTGTDMAANPGSDIPSYRFLLEAKKRNALIEHD